MKGDICIGNDGGMFGDIVKLSHVQVNDIYGISITGPSTLGDLMVSQPLWLDDVLDFW
jgi:hypothetical protein